MVSAGIVEAPSIKGADTTSADSCGYDAGKRVNGRKRHAVVDTIGLLVVVRVTAASVQDRDGGRLVLGRARMHMPSIALVWADGGSAGRLVARAGQCLRVTLEIARKLDGQRGLRGAARRWVGGGDAVVAGALPAAGPGYERPDHSEG